MYLEPESGEALRERLQAEAVPPDSLWLLLFADRHGEELPGLLAALRGKVRACGALFPGLIHGSTVRESGLLAIPLPPATTVTVADLAEKSVRWETPPPVIGQEAVASSMIFADCQAPGITPLFEDIFDRYGRRLTHFGAGAGYHDLRPGPVVFSERGLLQHAALLIMTPQKTAVRVRHGWTRVVGPFVASRTRGNVIQELNWEPAASFYRRQVIAQDPSFAGRPVFPDMVSAYPLSIGKEGGEDVILDPIRVTEDDELVVLSDVMENSLIHLSTGNCQSLVAAARQAVADCAPPAGSPGYSRCLVSDCYSRALMFGDAFGSELEAVRQGVAAFTDCVPEGVLALGEIASSGDQRIEFYNKTFVIAATAR